jgi:hypothetical protein
MRAEREHDIEACKVFILPQTLYHLPAATLPNADPV